jgi:hypothetical protein
MRFSTASLAAVLLCASGLWIGEEAADGRGLHLAVLWTVLSALTAVRQLIGLERPSGFRFGVLDLGVVMVAGGHLISAWQIEQAGGDRRAAWNLAMEWVGLSAAWYTLRTVCCSVRDRTLVIETLLTLTVGLAALGIWQHIVAFPRNAEWYLSRRGALDTALRTPGGEALQQVQEIIAEFGRMGIPLEGSSRLLWENRLLYSTEPLGPFALTNTLAALLAGGVVLAAAGWFGRRSGLLPRVGFGLSVAVLSYCLVLTKSRSAWLAAGCGLLAMALHHSRRQSLRVVLRAGIAAAGLAVVLTVIAAWLGALDREVILEAPKSLQYRLFYWTGSLEMLADRPFAGAGPGNFRQAYLPYKLDESSEEIRDPHNYLLEVWSSAGIVGLGGMLLFTGALIAGLWRSAEAVTDSPVSSIALLRPRLLPASHPAACVVVGWLLDTSWEWLSADSLQGKADEMLLFTGVGIVLLRRRLPEFTNSAAAMAAAAAILVHLLASGGFGVPVVMLVVVVCSAAGAAAGAAERGAAGAAAGGVRQHCAASGTVLGLSLMAAVAIVSGGLIPLVRSERALDAALAFAAEGGVQGDTAAAVVRRAFLTAVAADPRRVGIRQAWAEYEAGRLFLALPQSRVESGREAVRMSDAQTSGPLLPTLGGSVPAVVEEACGAWIEADPASFSGWQLRAMARRRVWENSADRNLLMQALSDLENCVQRHPGQVEIWLEKAELELAADLVAEAGRSVDRAVKLNQINHEWGHEDQYLSEAAERRLVFLGQGRVPSGDGGRQEIRDPEGGAGQKVP